MKSDRRLITLLLLPNSVVLVVAEGSGDCDANNAGTELQKNQGFDTHPEVFVGTTYAEISTKWCAL